MLYPGMISGLASVGVTGGTSPWIGAAVGGILGGIGGGIGGIAGNQSLSRTVGNAAQTRDETLTQNLQQQAQRLSELRRATAVSRGAFTASAADRGVTAGSDSFMDAMNTFARQRATNEVVIQQMGEAQAAQIRGQFRQIRSRASSETVSPLMAIIRGGVSGGKAGLGFGELLG